MKGVERWDRERDGEPTEAALRRKLEARGYRVVRYVYPPETVFVTHTREVDRVEAVVSGKLRVSMHGEDVVLEAGDAIDVPRGTPHRTAVVGDEPVVSLDAERARSTGGP
ncbi:MAG TPA: cupin domain-containing protein [Polyangiaceae bacterium]|nr:cupin domain-containing protein [Polyangiaceae bacterium]